MKIDSIKLPPAIETGTSQSSNSKVSNKSADPKSDQTSVSKLAAGLTASKEEKIEALRAAVASGSYVVSSSELAASLINYHLKDVK